MIVFVEVSNRNLSRSPLEDLFYVRLREVSTTEDICRHDSGTCAVEVMGHTIVPFGTLAALPVVVEQLMQQPFGPQLNVALAEQLDETSLGFLHALFSGVPAGVIAACPQKLLAAVVFQEGDTSRRVGLNCQ